MKKTLHSFYSENHWLHVQYISMIRRKKMKKAAWLMATTLLAGVLVIAQTKPGPPSSVDRAQHRVQFLTTVLSLTSGQQQQATTIFTNAATSQSALHDSMRAAHEALGSAVKNNDAAGIDAASNTLGQLTAQMTSINAKAQAAFNQILTADQQTKLAQLDKGGPEGFGGPGGFGMERRGPPPTSR